MLLFFFERSFHRKCVDPGSSLNCCARNSSVPVSLFISCLKQTPSSIVSLNCLSKTLEDLANVQMADGSEKPTRIIAVAVDHSEWSEQAFECECKSYLSFPAVVSFAAVFWDVTQCSTQRNGCSHPNNIPFHCVCGLVAVC